MTYDDKRPMPEPPFFNPKWQLDPVDQLGLKKLIAQSERHVSFQVPITEQELSMGHSRSVDYVFDPEGKPTATRDVFPGQPATVEIFLRGGDLPVRYRVANDHVSVHFPDTTQQDYNGVGRVTYDKGTLNTLTLSETFMPTIPRTHLPSPPLMFRNGNIYGFGQTAELFPPFPPDQRLIEGNGWRMLAGKDDISIFRPGGPDYRTYCEYVTIGNIRYLEAKLATRMTIDGRLVSVIKTIHAPYTLDMAEVLRVVSTANEFDPHRNKWSFPWHQIQTVIGARIGFKTSGGRFPIPADFMKPEEKEEQL